MNPDYAAFLARKAVAAVPRGMERVPELAPHLFPFQRHCVEFALRAGSSGLFLDTGLGKTECQLEFCQRAIEATNKPALILTPLAVAWQTKRRADRWGYEARVVREGAEVRPGINICNYDRLERLDPAAFGAVALDEASILKSFTGKTTRALIEAFKGCRFKIAATATPAPNDHMELGQYAEFCEVMASNEMLMRWFIADQTEMGRYRLKGHAVTAFWDWMASWTRMAERPSDLHPDYDDSGYDLPPFAVHRHRARESEIKSKGDDLFGALALSATNIFDLKRQTARERAKIAASIVHDGISRWISENARTNGSDGAMPPTPHIERPERPQRDVAQSGSDTKADSNPRSALKGKTTERFFSAKTAPAPSADREPPAVAGDGKLTIATRQAASADCFATVAMSGSANSQTTQRHFTAPHTISWGAKMPAWVLWCDTNEEQKLLEQELGDLCISIYGSQASDKKEELHQAWLDGARPVLVTKPSIFGFGCDWQRCANMIFVGRTFSYETYYQAVRRCWRFGQARQVQVHLVVAEGESEIGRVIDRKAGDHGKMRAAMRDAMRRANAQGARIKAPYEPRHTTGLPAWLTSAA